MFGGKRERPNYDKVDTIVGADTLFDGKLEAKGTLRIDGTVTGEVVVQGDIVIGTEGVVKANITARNVAISGAVYGNMQVSAGLELMPSARLHGDVRVGVIQIAEGAMFEGRCEMTRDKTDGQKKPDKKVEA